MFHICVSTLRHYASWTIVHLKWFQSLSGAVSILFPVCKLFCTVTWLSLLYAAWSLKCKNKKSLSRHETN